VNILPLILPVPPVTVYGAFFTAKTISDVELSFGACCTFD
jgi:hypothetical protein